MVVWEGMGISEKVVKMKGKERWKRVFGIALIGIVLVGVISPALALTQVMDFDYNDDGVVDLIDLAILGNHAGNESYYEQMYDNNYDGVINQEDANLLSLRYGIYNLNEIWEKLYKYHIYVEEEGKRYKVVAVNLNGISGGYGFQEEPNYYDWLDLDYHPYIPNEFVCNDFADNFFLASYKDFGYGVVFIAEGRGHLYNVVWSGGDFYNASNWYIIEPQNGNIVGTVAKYKGSKSIYDTYYIHFPIETIFSMGQAQYIVRSWVVTGDGKLEYYGYRPMWMFKPLEECPSSFDTDG